MTDTFDDFVQPAAPGNPVEWATLRGHLLVMQVLEAIDHVPTVHTAPGEKSPAVRVNLYVLDGPHAGEDHDNTLVFGVALRGQLAPNVGRKVIGRLSQGQASPGKSAPWLLAQATDADMAAAREWASRRSMVNAAPPAGNAYGSPIPSHGAQAPF